MLVLIASLSLFSWGFLRCCTGYFRHRNCDWLSISAVVSSADLTLHHASEAAMRIAFQPDSNPQLIWNEDDYQMQRRNDGKGVERLIVLRDSNDSSPPTTQGSEQGDMGFAI